MYIVEYKLEQNLQCRDLFNYLRRRHCSYPRVAAMVEKYTNKL